MASAIPDLTHAIAVKAKVDALLQEKGMSHAQLYRHMKLSSSTYSDMWSNGYVTVDRLIGMAEALDVPAAMLLPAEHRGEGMKRKPGDRPYVEDRLELVERELRQVKNQLKKRNT